MDYPKFKALLKGRETAQVDFKIQCDAFASKDLAPRAELAKDICAMANSGHVASYIIVGVSDDAKAFKSVANENLTDDALQDFCKKAIFPPPKVKLHRASWKSALPAHAGKEFIIIQIGPQPRQAFRLVQDFIDYKANLCFRRNEVWIRRGATSDLATPEEVERLVHEQSWEGTLDAALQQERDKFARMSQSERLESVTDAVPTVLKKIGYIQVPANQGLPIIGRYTIPTWRKTASTSIFLAGVINCLPTLTSTYVRDALSYGYFDRRFCDWNTLPVSVKALSRRRVRAIRRIWVVPVLGSASPSRVMRLFPDANRVTTGHYYRPQVINWGRDSSQISSSTELLIVDKIESVIELTDRLLDLLNAAELESQTLSVVPKE
jgi:hypothetical protein